MSHLIKLADEADQIEEDLKKLVDKLIDEVQAPPLRYKEEIMSGRGSYTEILILIMILRTKILRYITKRSIN